MQSKTKMNGHLLVQRWRRYLLLAVPAAAVASRGQAGNWTLLGRQLDSAHTTRHAAILPLTPQEAAAPGRRQGRRGAADAAAAQGPQAPVCAAHHRARGGGEVSVPARTPPCLLFRLPARRPPARTPARSRSAFGPLHALSLVRSTSHHTVPNHTWSLESNLIKQLVGAADPPHPAGSGWRARMRRRWSTAGSGTAAGGALGCGTRMWPAQSRPLGCGLCCVRQRVPGSAPVVVRAAWDKACRGLHRRCP